MQVYQLIKPFGIITYTLVLFTLLTGLKVIKIPFKGHRLAGIITLVCGSLHASLVLYVTFF